VAWFFIEADDVLMFRDGRPFTAGESHVIQSLFPPSPLTLQGALRSYILNQAGYALNDKTVKHEAHSVVGYGDDLRQFAMRGPFLARHQRNTQGDLTGKIEQMLPMPADLAVTKQTIHNQSHVVQVDPSRPEGLTNWPLTTEGWPLISDDVLDDWEGEPWLTSVAFAQYLRGELPPLEEVHYTHDLIDSEPRFGIGMNPVRRAVEEGMLYRADFKRPKPDVGLLVWVEKSAVAESKKQADLLPKDQFTLAIGGERHTVRVKWISDQEKDNNILSDSAFKPLQLKGMTNLKLTFLTPTYFAAGSHPASWTNFFSSGAEVTCVSAALPRYKTLSGWSLAAAYPGARPSIRLVPAGSVFYFQTNKLPDHKYATSLMDSIPTGFPPLTQLGYGRYALSLWSSR